MAVDKLVDSAQLDSDLTSVADAIRAKGGTSAQLAFPNGFVNAINNIPTGSAPTGTKQISITQNGTTIEDVTNYASAEINVNVESGGGYTIDNFLKREISGSVETNMTTFGGVTLDGFSGITSFSAPLLKNLYNANYMFRNCTSLTNMNMPSLKRVYGTNMFNGTLITSLVLPVLGVTVTDYNQTIFAANAFLNCHNLKSVDIYTIQRIDGNAFKNATLFDTLVIRFVHPNKDVKLSNISAFDGTPFASGGSGGTIYCPSDYIATMQSATNWSTILGYANNSIQAIEGSIYETQYADGTPIPSS